MSTQPSGLLLGANLQVPDLAVSNVFTVSCSKHLPSHLHPWSLLGRGVVDNGSLEPVLKGKVGAYELFTMFWSLQCVVYLLYD